MQFTRLRVLTSTFSLLNKGYKKQICEILFHYCGCSKKVFQYSRIQRNACMPIWYPKSNHFQFSLTQQYCNTSRWRWIECSSTFSNGCYLPSCGAPQRDLYEVGFWPDLTRSVGSGPILADLRRYDPFWADLRVHKNLVRSEQRRKILSDSDQNLYRIWSDLVRTEQAICDRLPCCERTVPAGSGPGLGRCCSDLRRRSTGYCHTERQIWPDIVHFLWRSGYDLAANLDAFWHRRYSDLITIWSDSVLILSYLHRSAWEK